jgi:hypothetical protein
VIQKKLANDGGLRSAVEKRRIARRCPEQGHPSSTRDLLDPVRSPAALGWTEYRIDRIPDKAPGAP